MVTKKGNASAIRKAFVAFKTVFVTNPLVVLSFEGRINPDECNAEALKFGRCLSMSVLGLPHGEFNLSDPFYETGSFLVKTDDENTSTVYANVGSYANSLNYVDSDYLDSERWLSVIAGLFCEAFAGENIPFPSRENLERMFLVGDNYAEVQKGLQYAFSMAKNEGKLEDVLLDVMSEYHKKFASFAAEYLLKKHPTESGVSAIKRIYSMLPFEIVSHKAVGAIYDGVLPVILASGVTVDQEKLFKGRIDRGRVFLKEFVGREFDEDDENDVFNALVGAIYEKPKELQPLLPSDLADWLNDEDICAQLAFVIYRATLCEKL